MILALLPRARASGQRYSTVAEFLEHLRPKRVCAGKLGNHDLVSQKGMPVGQVEDRLVRQLFCVVGARAPLEDDLVLGVNDVKVTNSPAGDAVDVTLDELGRLKVVLTEFKPAKLCAGCTSACQAPM